MSSGIISCTSNGVIVIKGLQGRDVADIPDNTIMIAPCAFANDDYIKLAIIPDSVTHIGEYAFANCDYLHEIRFSRNLARLDKNTVKNCIALSKIIVSKHTKVHKSAFVDCGNFDVEYWEDRDAKSAGFKCEDDISENNDLKFGQVMMYDSEEIARVRRLMGYNEAMNMDVIEYEKNLRKTYEPVEDMRTVPEEIDSDWELIED